MTTLENPQTNLKRAQDAALTRLVMLLEGFGTEPRLTPLSAIASTNSRLARLQLARANYVLNTSGEMGRVSEGGWVLSRPSFPLIEPGCYIEPDMPVYAVVYH